MDIRERKALRLLRSNKVCVSLENMAIKGKTHAILRKVDGEIAIRIFLAENQ
jgi:hypothetical protein